MEFWLFRMEIQDLKVEALQSCGGSSNMTAYAYGRGGKKNLFSGTATKSGKIFCELSTQILYNLN
jgi:hypothetical protein